MLSSSSLDCSALPGSPTHLHYSHQKIAPFGDFFLSRRIDNFSSINNTRTKRSIDYAMRVGRSVGSRLIRRPCLSDRSIDSCSWWTPRGATAATRRATPTAARALRRRMPAGARTARHGRWAGGERGSRTARPSGPDLTTAISQSGRKEQMQCEEHQGQAMPCHASNWDWPTASLFILSYYLEKRKERDREEDTARLTRKKRKERKILQL